MWSALRQEIFGEAGSKTRSTGPWPGSCAKTKKRNASFRARPHEIRLRTCSSSRRASWRSPTRDGHRWNSTHSHIAPRMGVLPAAHRRAWMWTTVSRSGTGSPKSCGSTSGRRLCALGHVTRGGSRGVPVPEEEDMKSPGHTLDPEVLAIVGEIVSDPDSVLLRELRKPLFGRWPNREAPLSAGTAFLNSAERHLLAAPYRDELADALYQASRRRLNELPLGGYSTPPHASLGPRPLAGPGHTVSSNMSLQTKSLPKGVMHSAKN